MAAKKWDENTDYSALINAAMESGSADTAYIQGLLDAREAKMQDSRWSQYNNPDYTSSVQDYINNINKQHSSSGGSGSGYTPSGGGNAGGLSDNDLYRTDVDYSALINAAMESGSTDADYIQGLLNSRIAKTQNQNWAQYGDPEYNKTVQDYINSLRKPAIDLDSIMSQISSYVGSAPEYSSRWDDTANLLAQAALEMNYGDWTESGQYAALADRYGRQGQMSMQDVLGQIASRTGGLASSYAATVADQQYNEYMAMLEEVARQMYAGERSDAIQNAQMAYDFADSDYQRYLNRLAQYNGDRSYAYQVLSDALAQSNYNREWQNTLEQQEYNRGQSSRNEAQQRIENYIAAGGSTANLDPALIESSGYSAAELAALEQYYTAQNSPKATGGSGGGGGGSQGAGDKWASVTDWVNRYGEDAAEDYIGEHYKDMGYSSKSAAVSGWNNYQLENGQTVPNSRNTGGRTADRTSLDYSEDEGIFRWNGKNYSRTNDLLSDIDASDLTAEEKNQLKRKFKIYGFDISF